jgi:hypothetical protein
MYLFFVSGLKPERVKNSISPIGHCGAFTAKNLRTQIWGGKDRGFRLWGQGLTWLIYLFDNQQFV